MKTTAFAHFYHVFSWLILLCCLSTMIFAHESTILPGGGAATERLFELGSNDVVALDMLISIMKKVDRYAGKVDRLDALMGIMRTDLDRLGDDIREIKVYNKNQLERDNQTTLDTRDIEKSLELMDQRFADLETDLVQQIMDNGKEPVITAATDTTTKKLIQKRSASMEKKTKEDIEVELSWLGYLFQGEQWGIVLVIISLLVGSIRKYFERKAVTTHVERPVSPIELQPLSSTKMINDSILSTRSSRYRNQYPMMSHRTGSTRSSLSKQPSHSNSNHNNNHNKVYASTQQQPQQQQQQQQLEARSVSYFDNVNVNKTNHHHEQDLDTLSHMGNPQHSSSPMNAKIGLEDSKRMPPSAATLAVKGSTDNDDNVSRISGKSNRSLGFNPWRKSKSSKSRHL